MGKKTVILSVDPGWVNLGWVLLVKEEGQFPRFEKGTHDLEVSYKSNVCSEYVIAITRFVYDVLLPAIRGPSTSEDTEEDEVVYPAIVIEQQPRMNKRYHSSSATTSNGPMLQQYLEAIIYSVLTKCSPDTKIHRINGVSYKRFFGSHKKNDPYPARKSKLLDKVNTAAKEGSLKYPVVLECATDHEADALGCLNVYIAKSHNPNFDIGILKEEDSGEWHHIN